MKDFTVKVPGVDFELSSNQIYHIREISDSDAPDGYQKIDVTKHPLPGVANGIVVPYHEGTRTWNTGFFEGSFCLSKEKRGEDILEIIKANLLPELAYLVEGDLTNGKSSNDEFFDEFVPFNGTGFGEDTSKFKIKGGNMFNTKNPLEFTALWFALIGRQIMPPNKEGVGSYKNCAFLLEDKKQSSSIELDKEYEKAIATSKILSIVSDREGNKKEISHLQNIFEYVGLKINIEETKDKPLLNSFNRWAEQGGFKNENSKEFNEIINKFKEEESREELVVYSKLLKDIKNSKVKVERRDIFINGQNLGSDKKSAAKLIVTDQELHKDFLLI